MWNALNTGVVDNETVKQVITKAILEKDFARAEAELESASIDYPRIAGKQLLSAETIESFKQALLEARLESLN